MNDFPHIEKNAVDIGNAPQLAGQLSIFTVPVLLLFIDGKEVLREARFVHIEEFRSKIKKIVDGLYS